MAHPHLTPEQSAASLKSITVSRTWRIALTFLTKQGSAFAVYIPDDVPQIPEDTIRRILDSLTEGQAISLSDQFRVVQVGTSFPPEKVLAHSEGQYLQPQWGNADDLLRPPLLEAPNFTRADLEQMVEQLKRTPPGKIQAMPPSAATIAEMHPLDDVSRDLKWERGMADLKSVQYIKAGTWRPSTNFAANWHFVRVTTHGTDGATGEVNIPADELSYADSETLHIAKDQPT